MRYWNQFNLFALIFFAISVSLGASLVSISKAMVIVSFIWYLIIINQKQKIQSQSQLIVGSWAVCIICSSIAWLILSTLWSEASPKEIGSAVERNIRFLLVPVVIALISEKKVSYKVLGWMIVSHVIVVGLSFLMYFGVHIPFVQIKQPFEYAVPFTSSLEQPVMSALVVILLWYLKDEWKIRWIKYASFVSIALCIVNVFFIMMGRTGFLLMLISIGFIIFFELPKKLKVLALLVPLFISFVLFNTSTRFYEKTQQIKDNLTKYEEGNYDTSEGQRLDYWMRSIQSIQESPIVGKGLGSWKKEYQRLGGKQNNPPSNPHNQFLLWWVEGGCVGLMLLIAIFIMMFLESMRLDKHDSRALICITALSLVMSLFNCPFYGVGMGEFFMILFGALLATGKDSQTSMKLPKALC